MPKGVFIRTEEHKRNISLAMKGKVVRGYGFRHSEETRKKIGDAQRGEKSRNWKQDNLGYSGLHAWLIREHGRATDCKQEDSTCKGAIDWACVRGNYIRDINEFMGLCRSHHVRYDRKAESNARI